MLREYVVKHEVDYDASKRNVQPQRISPARDRAMPVKAILQGATQRNDHQRHDRGREDRMRGQNAEIERPPEAVALKSDRADVRVVVQVGN
jgi:hypothetical protein